MKSMDILVKNKTITGLSGFLGHKIISILKYNNKLILVDKKYQKFKNLKNITFYKVDFLDEKIFIYNKRN